MLKIEYNMRCTLIIDGINYLGKLHLSLLKLIKNNVFRH